MKVKRKCTTGVAQSNVRLRRLLKSLTNDGDCGVRGRQDTRRADSGARKES